MTVTRSSTLGYGGGTLTGYKGVLDCSTSPNYPAAMTGDMYIVSVAGKIGGASGLVVVAGDMMICKATAAAGNQATVGSSWDVIETNADWTAVAITGGTINGTTIGGTSPAVGTFTTANATTFDTNVAAAGVTLSGTTLSADGTDVDININVTPKGAGSVVMSKVDINAGSVDGTPIGASSASTGAFTALTMTGGITVNRRASGAADFTTAATDYVIAIDNTAAPRAVNLQTATCTSGRVYVIKDESGVCSVNNITIQTEGAEKIDGQDTLVLSTNYDSVTLYSNGSNWFVIDRVTAAVA